jgi:hypothetical protein
LLVRLAAGAWLARLPPLTLGDEAELFLDAEGFC